MLKINNLNLSFGTEPLFKQLNLSIFPGQLFLLKGANGSGKTTLLNAISGVIPEHLEAIISGDICLSNQDLSLIPLREKFHTLWYAQSDCDKQFFFPTCEAELAFALENKGITAPEIINRITQSAKRFGLESCLQQSPFTLSGGQKKLLLCAIGAALDSPLLLLDEPLAGLSESSVQIVLNWLKEQKEQGKILIVAEHNPVVKALADMELHLGSYMPDELPTETKPVTLHISSKSDNISEPSNEDIFFIVNDLHFAYPTQNKLFSDFNLKLSKGECVLLQGENGSGKSTLLKLLLGLLQPESGSIVLAGQVVKSFIPSMFRHVFYQSQATRENLLGISATQNWQFWRIAQPGLPQDFYQQEAFFSESSAGQLQCYAQDILPWLMDKFWLLDEPFNHLDAAARKNLVHLLHEKRKSGSGMLVVAHEILYDAKLFDRVIAL